MPFCYYLNRIGDSETGQWSENVCILRFDISTVRQKVVTYEPFFMGSYKQHYNKRESIIYSPALCLDYFTAYKDNVKMKMKKTKMSMEM